MLYNTIMIGKAGMAAAAGAAVESRTHSGEIAHAKLALLLELRLARLALRGELPPAENRAERLMALGIVEDAGGLSVEARSDPTLPAIALPALHEGCQLTGVYTELGLVQTKTPR